MSAAFIPVNLCSAFTMRVDFFPNNISLSGGATTLLGFFGKLRIASLAAIFLMQEETRADCNRRSLT